MKILRIRMDKKSTALEEIPGDWKHLGGSALIARIMTLETPPETDPLGPENPFIIAAGPLAGLLEGSKSRTRGSGADGGAHPHVAKIHCPVIFLKPL